ncbi:hypothetical protein [Aquimarina aggregata]|uniref:hypothetical protein n=1 Tax=Aquimarina aggregata TaxID=1642818 RepID=UPI000A6B8CB4|nr:hypothetical protein [Aquimarina aggregata]
MNKLAFVIIVLGLSFVSCEKNDDINEQSGIELEEIYSTDKGDAGSPGSGPLDEGDTDD